MRKGPLSIFDKKYELRVEKVQRTAIFVVEQNKNFQKVQRTETFACMLRCAAPSKTFVLFYYKYYRALHLFNLESKLSQILCAFDITH
jgi:hypothetical protein